MKVLGIDPGLASLGAVLIEGDRDSARWVAGELVATQKAKGKERKDVRVSADDARRYREIWNALDALVRAHDVNAIAVETFNAYQPAASASKTGIVYGLVHGLGLAHGRKILPFRPDDIKREIVGKRSGSKREVQEALCSRVDGFDEAIARFAKTKREHIGDAAALAVLGLGVMTELNDLFNN